MTLEQMKARLAERGLDLTFLPTPQGRVWVVFDRDKNNHGHGPTPHWAYAEATGTAPF